MGHSTNGGDEKLVNNFNLNAEGKSNMLNCYLRLKNEFSCPVSDLSLHYW